MASEVERVKSLQTAHLGLPMVMQLAKQVLFAIYKRGETQAVQERSKERLS